MFLALACALCATNPALVPADADAPPTAKLLDRELTAPDVSTEPPPATADQLVALGHLQHGGSGDDGGSGHGDHMTVMWVMMGIMVAAMVVGMAVYLGQHGARAGVVPSSTVSAPASFAVPVPTLPGGR